MSLIPDFGFETPVVGHGSYEVNPSGSSWTWSGAQAGIAGNNNNWNNAWGPEAPEGEQAGFLYDTGSFSQSVSGWAAGTYLISFFAAQAGINNASQQDFQVLVDGTVYGHFTPSSSSYALYTTSPFTVTSGSHTIEFLGLNTADSGNNAVLIDDIGAYPSTLTYATLLGPSSESGFLTFPVEFTITLNGTAGSGGVIWSLSSPGFASDTFQATFGGSNITSITIPDGSSTGTFWFTPGGLTGARTVTATATSY